MLRACWDLLVRGGYVAGYSIHAEAGGARAVELGPGEVCSEADLSELHLAAGFGDVLEYDTTDDFAHTCRAVVEAARRLRDRSGAVREATFLAEELARKSAMLQGIEEGRLRRSLVVAHKP